MPPVVQARQIASLGTHPMHACSLHNALVTPLQLGQTGGIREYQYINALHI